MLKNQAIYLYFDVEWESLGNAQEGTETVGAPGAGIQNLNGTSGSAIRTTHEHDLEKYAELPVDKTLDDYNQLTSWYMITARSADLSS